MTFYFQRLMRSGECDFNLLSYRAGRYSGSGSIAGYDNLLCGAFAPTCEAVAADLDAFVAANKDCVEDADCVRVDAPCWAGEPCCSAYFHTGLDRGRWADLNNYTGTCSHQINDFGSCGCACPSPPAAACIGGRCAAAPP